MECKGELTNIAIDFATKKPICTFLLDTQQITSLEELKGLKLNLNVKKYYKKRSLDSNAYLWKLLNLLADKINVPPKDIYKDAISYLNTYYVVPLPVSRKDKFISDWQHNGDGWFCEEFASKLEGYVNIRAYYGTSVFDTNEMAKLLDNIIEECKAQGIETMTPKEIEKLKGAWHGK